MQKLSVGVLSILVWATIFAFSQIDSMEAIDLPAPRFRGNTSIEQALHSRRSIRSYQDIPLELEEVAQLLWAAQGITEPVSGFRTAPSAGATYPLEVYAVVGKAKGLSPGVYRYLPEKHRLVRILEGDIRPRLALAALGQSPVKEAPVVFLISAIYRRTATRYGNRAERYVLLEAGHAAQNIALQAVGLGLGSVMIGAFQDAAVKNACQLPREEEPLYLIPVGRPSF